MEGTGSPERGAAAARQRQPLDPTVRPVGVAFAHQLGAGEALIVPADETFELANPHDEAFEAVAVMPVGGRATLPGGDPFVPPWAE